MSTYRSVSQQDFQEAELVLKHRIYRTAVYLFQQFAEKGAKSLLEKKDPTHKSMRSHRVEDILAAYDEAHKISGLSDMARYLTSFYFNTRYPGDNYSDVTEAQAQKAHQSALELKKYFDAELDRLDQMNADENIDIDGLKKLV